MRTFQDPAIQSTSHPAPEWISQESIRAVCTASGPFVTVFLPAFHPGAADLPGAERLRTILRTAAKELESRRFQGSIDRLLRPLKDLAENARSLAGGTGLVIFAGPDLFLNLRLPAPATERLVLGSYPQITPLLSHLLPFREFYVLALSKKALRLGRWRDGQLTEAPLPATVPTSFEESLVSDQPDHDLQNHSPASSSLPGGSTRFGTGSQRDGVHDQLHRYFHVVDRELTPFLKGVPLVLVGIAQELAAYRSVAKYSELLCAEPTSPGHLPWADLAGRAHQAVLSEQKARAQKPLAAFHDTTRRNHVVTGVREVLEASREGRVHTLLMEENAEHQGLLGPSFSLEMGQLEGEQDLINAAAVKTIQTGGEVYVIDKGQLDGRGIGALLRY